MLRSAAAQDDAPHELEFTASVAAWMMVGIDRNPEWPFAEVRCERRTQGIQKRRDLTILGKDGKIVATGEVKLPYQKDGASPYNTTVVRDARRKAQRAGAPFFFTWNVNECVLWRTDSPADDPAAPVPYKSWQVVQVAKSTHLALPDTERALQRWVVRFLYDLAEIVRGVGRFGVKAPDERFIDALESALAHPIRATFEELESRYRTPSGRADLDAWMREQGWFIATDPEGVRDNLDRAAKFACYALVNRLVFHEALLKRYGRSLRTLAVPSHVDDGEDLRLFLDSVFSRAQEATGDYETVFGVERAGVGARIPFYSNRAVGGWRELIAQIHEFDFSKLDYEVIGAIFERLIDPAERHKYGQFYTRAEVVDLMESFCITRGHETVLDPACGGGTFLVRAYARKRELAPAAGHRARIAEIFGVDQSAFAAHLATINLASRDLVEEENYPLVARADFFDVRPHRPFLTLPASRLSAKGLGAARPRAIDIPPLDVVIGNPPYVRQEEIKRDRAGGRGADGPARGTKEFYRQLVRGEASVQLSGRSDLHCYFWPHAANFLKPDGWLCFLTSSQWLDVEYGFRLQEWILARFQIVAVFESVDEPWFVGARVATTATLLRRCDDAAARAANVVRFVQLRCPIAKLLAHDGTAAGAMAATDALRDEILGLERDTTNERYRCRLVPQRQLFEDGVRLGRLMRGAAVETDDEAEDEAAARGEYYGGKWGIHLRAPDLWFDMVDRFSARLCPLRELADVRFGVKSGKDEFFYPIDASHDCLAEYTEPQAFAHEFGVARGPVETGEVKLVKCGPGKGEIRPIEARFLEPEVHSLMEVTGYTVKPADCKRLILLVAAPKSKLRGTHVLRYIEWGEAQGWHKGATCAARVTDERSWYDLTGHRRGPLFWPKAQQYKHAAPSNEHELTANCNLYDVTPADGIDADVLGGILNSSWTVLAKYQYGRPVGNEGNLKTEVVDVSMMPVADPRCGTAAARQRVAAAWTLLKKRDALQFLSVRRLRQMGLTRDGREKELKALSDVGELDMHDRVELDDAVLELVGVTGKRERVELVRRLHSHLREFFELLRQKEEKAIENKNRTRRGSVLSPKEVAVEIHRRLGDLYPRLVHKFESFVDSDRPFDTFHLPKEGTAQLHDDMFASKGSVRFMKGRRQLDLVVTRSPAQARLLALIADNGVRGYVWVPFDADACDALRESYALFLEERAARVRELIAERTADEDLQEAIESAVADLMIEHL